MSSVARVLTSASFSNLSRLEANTRAISEIEKTLRLPCVTEEKARSSSESWIFSASDEYLAVLDKAGVIPMLRPYSIDDTCTAWAAI